MTEQMFKDRTKSLALDVIRLAAELPTGKVPAIVAGQLVRAGTSVGANYRAACRGRSTAAVLNKLGIVEEEADETLSWLEILVAAGFVSAARVKDLQREADEILAMTVASIKTLRQHAKIQAPKSKA